MKLEPGMTVYYHPDKVFNRPDEQAWVGQIDSVTDGVEFVNHANPKVHVQLCTISGKRPNGEPFWCPDVRVFEKEEDRPVWLDSDGNPLVNNAGWVGLV